MGGYSRSPSDWRPAQVDFTMTNNPAAKGNRNYWSGSTWLVVVGSGLGHGPLLRAKPAYGRMADIEAPANIRQGLASGTTGQCLGHLVSS